MLFQATIDLLKQEYDRANRYYNGLLLDIEQYKIALGGCEKDAETFFQKMRSIRSCLEVLQDKQEEMQT